MKICNIFFLFKYLIKTVPGADPGLILGCCQNFTKMTEHRNDATCRKIMIQQESSRYSFDYSRGTDLKVQVYSRKKHSRITSYS